MKSKFGGSESTNNHGTFIKQNVDRTSSIFSDDGPIGRSNFLKQSFDVGTTVHSNGEFVNRQDIEMKVQAFDTRHDQNDEHSFKQTRGRHRKRNGNGLKNVFISEQTQRQKSLFLEDWINCFTNGTPADVCITWWMHDTLLFLGLPVEQ